MKRQSTHTASTATLVFLLVATLRTESLSPLLTPRGEPDHAAAGRQLAGWVTRRRKLVKAVLKKQRPKAADRAITMIRTGSGRVVATTTLVCMLASALHADSLNLATNGGFEQGELSDGRRLNGWVMKQHECVTPVLSAENPHSGQRAFTMTRVQEGYSLLQSKTIALEQPDIEQVVIEAWRRGDVGGAIHVAGVRYADGTRGSAQFEPPGWQEGPAASWRLGVAVWRPEKPVSSFYIRITPSDDIGKAVAVDEVAVYADPPVSIAADHPAAYLEAGFKLDGDPTGEVFAVGEEEGSQLISAEGVSDLRLYREMHHQGLTVQAVDTSGRQENLWLQRVSPYALTLVSQHSAERRLGRQFTIPPELLGLPGLVGQMSVGYPYDLTFSVDKPARLYAYIDFYSSKKKGELLERDQWQIYRRELDESMNLYYRDVSAGTHTFSFGGGRFYGVGVHSLERLSAPERLAAYARVGGDTPAVVARNDFQTAVPLTLDYQWLNAGSGKEVTAGRKQVLLDSGVQRTVPIPDDHLVPGVVYLLNVTASAESVQRTFSAPYGRFPPPAPDASVQEPWIPYGGYLKLDLNNDPALIEQALRATLYQMRTMHMNTVVMDQLQGYRLDLVHDYRMRAVIRLAGKDGEIRDIPDEIVQHPAVLTCMIGDEPHINHDGRGTVEDYVQAYTEVAARYPQFKPITCTIFDSYARGDAADPVRIYNDYLDEFDLIRFGRLYNFQKVEYGLLRPPVYKSRIPVGSVFSALEADERPWWFAAQFFGKEKPLPDAYWRVPGGTELRCQLHLALAHRCGGILGWCLHSHGPVESVAFEGATGAPSTYARHDQLRQFGRELMTAKPVLARFTTELLQVHKKRPYQARVVARRLDDGRMAIYVVNRDVASSHPVQFAVGPFEAGFCESAAVAENVFAGQTAAMETIQLTFDDNEYHYLRFAIPGMSAGAAALIVVTGTDASGALAW